MLWKIVSVLCVIALLSVAGCSVDCEDKCCDACPVTCFCGPECDCDPCDCVPCVDENII